MAKYTIEHSKGECETCPMFHYEEGNGWGNPVWICYLIHRENCGYPITKEECPLIEEGE